MSVGPRRLSSSTAIRMALVAEDLGLRGFWICEADHNAPIGLPGQLDLQPTWCVGMHESERYPAVLAVSEGSDGGRVGTYRPAILKSLPHPLICW